MEVEMPDFPFLIGATFLIGASCAAITLWVAAASLWTMLH
jgi:hypothetical protein